MRDNSFFYFLTLSLLKEKRRYLAIFIISTILIFLLSSVLFISSSIKTTLNKQLSAQPDLVLQSIKGGVVYPINEDIINRVLNIYGVDKVTKRVYGRYFFDEKRSALIIGVDFLDEQSNKNLAKIIDSTNLKEFLKTNNMLVGAGVYDYLKKHFYKSSYNFLTPQGKIVKVNIFKILDKKEALFNNDFIIVPLNLAKEILGLKSNEITDIALNVPNESELDTIKAKLQELLYSSRVISKSDVKKVYEKLFDYKSGLFLTLYLITITTFALILYLRYTLAVSVEKKEIAILRALGWSINRVLKLKFFENLSIIIFALLLGTSLAYIYVFMLNSPILKDIFLGSNNLKNFSEFIPVIDFRVLATIYILFTVLFLGAILIPIWKIATSEPKEIL